MINNIHIYGFSYLICLHIILTIVVLLVLYKNLSHSIKMSQQKIEIEKSKGLEIHYLETHNDNDNIQNEISNKSEICENEIETGKEGINLKTVHKGPKVHKCDPCGKLFT